MAVTPHIGAHLRFQPRIRKGAFFDAAWRHGCRNFSVYNRTYISGPFSDPVDEYWQVVERVALWPAMGERQVEISGPDASRFVQHLTPRDMSKCAVHQCEYALITTPDGGIIGDPIIMRLAQDRFWLSTSDCDLELWARGVAVGAGMDITIRDANVSVIQIQGPKSPHLLSSLFGDAMLDLKNYWSMPVPFEGATLQLSRTGWSGEFGYELYLSDAHLGDRLFDALMEAGKPFDVAPGAVNQARRIESGILSAGVDMTQAENPFELGMGRLVELADDRDFVGKPALEKLAAMTPARQLAGLIVDGDVLHPNEDVWPLVTSAGSPAGRLTSLACSPRLNVNIALAIVDRTSAAIGTVLHVDTWDGPRTASVTALPFLPKKQSGKARELVAA